jgi:SET domain-containing protein
MAASLSRPPRFRIGRSATGLGMFALEPIRKGRFIARYSGRKIDSDKADELDNKYLFEINSRWTIDGATRRNIARYINHSCRPNAEVYFVGHVIKIRAIKNIKPEQEITYNYGRDYFDSFLRAVGCKCLACVRKRARLRAEKRKSALRKKKRAAAKARNGM